MGIKLVVGLGNPGKPYEGTRHNIGFDVLDGLAEQHQLRFKRSWRLSSRRAWLDLNGNRVLLLKPQTYMNRSGLAVAKALRIQGLKPEELLLVYDDVDLPAGNLRLRKGGGTGGHNGIRSIVDVLGTKAFPRLRFGVGKRPQGEDLVEYVLSKWPAEDKYTLRSDISRSADAVRYAIESGLDAAMNKFNKDTKSKD